MTIRDARAEALQAKERARREREQAEARASYLDEIGRRPDRVWQEIENLVKTMRPTDYDRAARLLVDLRDACARTNRNDEFKQRFDRLKNRHHRKTSLIKRLREAGVVGEQKS